MSNVPGLIKAGVTDFRAYLPVPDGLDPATNYLTDVVKRFNDLHLKVTRTTSYPNKSLASLMKSKCSEWPFKPQFIVQIEIWVPPESRHCFAVSAAACGVRSRSVINSWPNSCSSRPNSRKWCSIESFPQATIMVTGVNKTIT